MVYPFIGEMNPSEIYFTPIVMENGKQKVELFRDNSSTKPSNKVVFNLTADITEPFEAKYPLDAIREDSDGSRRGFTLKVQDAECERKLREFDDTVIATAMKNSKEWFKKSNMTEDEVRLRYKPILTRAKEEDDYYSIKFKVKCLKYPTRLHLFNKDGTGVLVNKGTLDDISKPGCKVAPILTAYSVWFMGGTSFGVTLQAEEMVIEAGDSGPQLSNFINKKRKVEMIEAASEANDVIRLQDEEGEEGESAMGH